MKLKGRTPNVKEDTISGWP